MIIFLKENIGTIIVVALLALSVFLVVRRFIKTAKSGGCVGCSSNCGQKKCHLYKKEDEKPEE